MGTTALFQKPTDVKAYMDDLYSFDRRDAAGNLTGETSRVLRSAILHMRTYYAAVEHILEDGTRSVYAGVAILSYKMADGLAFGYKDMSERMGPCEAQCPEAILDLLTPTDHGHATEWRERCRAYHAARKAKPRLVEGTTITLTPPVAVRGGGTISRLVVRDVRRSVFRDPDTGNVFRAPWVKSRPFVISSN